MKTHILGYPRIGAKREIKKACEKYWAGKISQEELLQAGKAQRQYNWQVQKEEGVELIPSNDFSFYDQVLDMSLTVGAIPTRYEALKKGNALDLYFAMARGYQKEGKDVIAMEMTKWFDTNYHYIVPEFSKDQQFHLFSEKFLEEYREAKALDIASKPVLIGAISYLLLGKEKEEGFHRVELLDKLLPVYLEIIEKLQAEGATWIQFDEPYLGMDLTSQEQAAYRKVYAKIREAFPKLNILVATYFEGLQDNTSLALSLPVCALHLDLVRYPEQLDVVLEQIPEGLTLSLGVVDGRNIWKNNFHKSLEVIGKVEQAIGKERIMIAPSCSLLHTPFDLDSETDEKVLTREIKNWMAFAKQKVKEVVTLGKLVNPETHQEVNNLLVENTLAIESRQQSKLIHKEKVKERVDKISENMSRRHSTFEERMKKQQDLLKLPLFPTTTIGSFPQTDTIRKLRRQLKKAEITQKEYEAKIKEQIEEVVKWQEEVGLDVLVHGEYERNDMVEYFGELLDGYVFTQNGWVQSYGSRGVKPPVIFGDISRKQTLSVGWSVYAQSLTSKFMKGMLTGPVTMLQWSFVRDDQPREVTAKQLALVIRDEVRDLEEAGIKIIQIDEPAFREGLPLRKKEWDTYLQWAVNAFKISSCVAEDETQIHTHMCYSEFNDILPSIAALDADVITIETSRSQMELLEGFGEFKYPNGIGPGVYDIHSPRVPSVDEIKVLLVKALNTLPKEHIWVNPDCGLKTRKWNETLLSLKNMVNAADLLREKYEGVLVD